MHARHRPAAPFAFPLLAAIMLALLKVSTGLAQDIPDTTYFSDDFSSASKYFFEGSLDGRLFTYRDGEYEIDTTGGQTYGQSILTEDLSVYRIDTTAYMVESEDQGAGFGLSFNYQPGGENNDFLLFLAYNKGAFTVLRFLNGETTVLVEPAKTKLFGPGDRVGLTVENVKGDITCYINGVEVARLQEGTLSTGGVGVFATANSVVRFDNFEIKADTSGPAPSINDDFSGSHSLFEGTWGDVSYGYRDGRYVIDTASTAYLGLSPFPAEAKDFEFSADVELLEGESGKGFGLYARDTANASGKFDQFRFFVSGGWVAVEQSLDDYPKALSEWAQHSAVRETGVNNLKIRIDGSDVVFFVNSVEVWRGADEHPRAGNYGFIVSGGMKVAFDNAVVTFLD